ncbi:MAG: cupin domain-containing protein [Elusimicrobiota bacterium]
MTRSFSIVVLTLSAVLSSALDAGGPVVQPSGQIEWKASGSLPPGVEYHLIYEDKATRAVQILVRMPKGYSLPTHTHSHDETILVLKGKVSLEFSGKSHTLGPGGYALIPAKTPFSIAAGGFGGAQFFASFNGPYDLKTAN